MSARILTVLPFLMALWQWRANPDNFALLTHGCGPRRPRSSPGSSWSSARSWVRKIVNSIAL